MMRKTALIALMIILGGIISCETSTKETVAYPECIKPADIPDTLRDGTKVYWDCSWHASYLNGDVRVKYYEDGTARWIERSTGTPIGEWKKE